MTGGAGTPARWVGVQHRAAREQGRRTGSAEHEAGSGHRGDGPIQLQESDGPTVRQGACIAAQHRASLVGAGVEPGWDPILGRPGIVGTAPGQRGRPFEHDEKTIRRRDPERTRIVGRDEHLAAPDGLPRRPRG